MKMAGNDDIEGWVDYKPQSCLQSVVVDKPPKRGGTARAVRH